MKIFFILVFSLVWSLPQMAQNNFEVEILCNDLLEEVNKLRAIDTLKPFSRNEVLDAVAFDQAAYIIKTGNLTHTQASPKREKLSDRILYYEGLFSQVGENIAQIGLNSKVVLELGQVKKTADTPEKMLFGALNSWLTEEEGSLNLLDPNFLMCGISILENANNELIIVLVMASESYVIPEGSKISFNNYGIEPYTKLACDAFLTEHGSLSQLFSDGFKIENGFLKLKYNSLGYWNEIIANGKDGLAVEIISRDQYSCASTNKLFPGEITNGLLLKPFYKSKLTSLNTAIEKDEVDINLGQLPPFFNESEFEINGMILKNNAKCVSIPFNKLKTENNRWLDLPFLNSSAKIDSTLTGADTAQVNFTYSSIESELAKLQVLMNGVQFQLENLDIKVRVAPSSEITEEEISNRISEALSQYFSPSIAINYSIKVDWEGYANFKKGTFYQLETKDFNKEQEIAYLIETKKTDNDLKVSLENISQVDLAYNGTYDLKKSLSYESRSQLLGLLIQKNKIDLALHFQNELIKEGIREEKELQLLVTDDQQQLKQTLPMINNQIIAQHTIGKMRFDGNPIHTAFLELYLIDESDPILSYNYHLALLKYWSESVKNISDVGKWKKNFERLRGSSLIDPKTYSKTYLNYLIIAADYYYEQANFDKRKKAFDELSRYATIADLSNGNLLSVAKYLCYQDQFPRAIEILLPEVKKENVSEMILFYFLQIAIYDKHQVNEKLYLSMLEKGQQLYPDKFCSLFSKESMGVQQLIKPGIKELYCNHCHE